MDFFVSTNLGIKIDLPLIVEILSATSKKPQTLYSLYTHEKIKAGKATIHKYLRICLKFRLLQIIENMKEEYRGPLPPKKYSLTEKGKQALVIGRRTLSFFRDSVQVTTSTSASL